MSKVREVFATSVRHGDVLRLHDADACRRDDDGRTREFRVVDRIYGTSTMVGLNLYPCDVEPGRTYATLVWFPRRDRVERVR